MSAPACPAVLCLPDVATLNVCDAHHGAGKQDDYTQRHDLLGALHATVADGQDWLAERPGAVAILHGDTLNGVDQGLAECLAHPETREALSLYAALCQPCPHDGDGRPVWIVGNHDDGVEKLAGKDALLRRFRFARAVIVGGHTYHTHGHEWDWACSGAMGWIGRAAARVAGWIGKRSPEMEDRLRAMGGRDSDHGAFHRTVARDVARWNVERRRAGLPPFLRVVCGHTHEEACRDVPLGPAWPGDGAPALLYTNLGLGARDGFLRLPPG